MLGKPKSIYLVLLVLSNVTWAMPQVKTASNNERSEMFGMILSAVEDAGSGSMREARTKYERIYGQLKKKDFGPEVTWKGLDGYAKVLMTTGDVSKAISVLAEAKEAGAKFEPAALVKSTFDRAYALGRSGDIEGAVQEYEAARALSPENPDILLELGATYRAAKQYDKAHATYEKLLAVRPNYDRAHGNVGNLWLTEGKLEEALAEFEKAAALSKDKSWAAKNFLNVAFQYQQQHRFEQALATCQRAVAIAPGLPLAHADLGISLAGLGRKAEAKAEFQRGLALSPDEQTRKYIELAQAKLD